MSPVPSPKAVVRKAAHSCARAQKACQGQWPPRELAVPPKRSHFLSMGSPQPPDLTPLCSPLFCQLLSLLFQGKMPTVSCGCHPPFFGQQMDSKLFSEYRTALLLTVRYVPVLSALPFPARGVTRQRVAMFSLQMREPSSETLRGLLQDPPGFSLRLCHPVAVFSDSLPF